VTIRPFSKSSIGGLTDSWQSCCGLSWFGLWTGGQASRYVDVINIKAKFCIALHLSTLLAPLLHMKSQVPRTNTTELLGALIKIGNLPLARVECDVFKGRTGQTIMELAYYSTL